jgi:hypothetical protein
VREPRNFAHSQERGGGTMLVKASVLANRRTGNAQIESATTKFILGTNELSTQC